MKILLIRMMGLGDVASILIPAVHMMHQRYPAAKVDVMTYRAGNELMMLVPRVHAMLPVESSQWPEDLLPAADSFLKIAEVVMAQDYDLIINLDTWFMPCFMAQALFEAGLPVQGNHLNCSVAEFFQKLRQGVLTQAYFQLPEHYMASTFPHMQDWTKPWWQMYPEAGSYPEFYLRHCCGFPEAFRMELDVMADSALLGQADGRRIVALSMSGSKPGKQYPHAAKLRQLLQQAGYLVWSQFDGSAGMPVTLGRLKVTDLLITVPTSTQWLAKLVACPSLMIPGALPPAVLGAELTMEPVLPCQYCFQSSCVEGRNFACMAIAPEQVLQKAHAWLAQVSPDRRLARA